MPDTSTNSEVSSPTAIDAAPLLDAPDVTTSRAIWGGVFAAAHIVLAIAMRAFPVIGTVHALACLGVGLFIAATTRRMQYVAWLVAYIAGCEVLWRMCKAGVFWEFGKYSMIAIMLVAIVRLRVRHNLGLAFAYFGLLTPSIVLTLELLGLGDGRDQISFALSGPLAIACAAVFFSSIRLSALQLRAAFLGFIAPIAGVSALVFIKTEGVAALEFANNSNSMTSGGFGPNQVSAVMGLAMMLLILLALDRMTVWWLRLALLVPSTILAFQTVLTFARGGIMLALAGLFGAAFGLLRANRRARVGVIIVAIASYAIGTYIVTPALEQQTGGEVSLRYLNTQSSGRDQIVDTELEFFRMNPIMGVGPGVGTFLRLENGDIGPSHTEYTRMLAEHGILGLLSLVCLVALGFRAVRGSDDRTLRGMAAAMVIWGGLFLAIYATRLAAPAFALGLAFAISKSRVSRAKAAPPTELVRLPANSVA